MERELLEDKRSPLQVATERLLERFDFFHAINKFYAWFASNLLRKFVRFVNLKDNFIIGGLHALGEQFSLVLIQILRLNLSFLDVVSVISHMTFDKSMQLSLFDCISPLNFF